MSHCHHCCQQHEHHSHAEHEHEHGSVRQTVIRIVVATILLILAYVVERNVSLQPWALLLIYLPAYWVAGENTLKEAFHSITHGEALDEHFLMTVATLGAIAIGFLPKTDNQLHEAVFVMLFFQVGELFESIATGNSHRSIRHLLAIRPDSAHVLRDGVEETVKAQEVRQGDTVLIRPGERVPIDGVVTQGSSSLDTAALTGESLPKSVNLGDEITSGCVNLTGPLQIRATRVAQESTASRIILLVSEAAERKSSSETFISRFARIYTPIVVALAFVIALTPLATGGDFVTWIYRALMFLVVSCPCALVLSIPLTFFGGIGAASRKGILIKGSNYLEKLTQVRTVVFDKTGTLTKGKFEVTAVHPQLIDEQELLHLAAHVERYSNHPIASSLRDAYPNENDLCTVTHVQEIAGQGIVASVNSHSIAVGNERLMEAVGARWRSCHKTGTVVHVAIDGEYAGHIVISDCVKPDSAEAIRALRKAGVQQIVMLTGDQEAVAQEVAQETGVDVFHANLLPADKVVKIEQLLQNGNGMTAMVGDGINDAPVLARADLGIAMGGLGSDAAIEAADVVLMDDSPSKIATAMRIAKRTQRIAKQNAYGSIGTKIIILILAAAGYASMGMAVFADVGVMILAVLNAARTLRL